MSSKQLNLCQPFLLLPSIFPSIRVFSNELALCIRWAKYWSFSFNNSPSSEYLGVISFRIDWCDLLKVQGTLQLHNLKASVLQHSAFFGIPWWLSRSGIRLQCSRPGFNPWVGTGGGHGNPLQYSCLENPHGQRSLEDYNPWGWQRAGHN